MTACRRFEEEGLELLESGEPLGEHFFTCPDCRDRRAAHEALVADLAVLGAAEKPPADWRERVRREVRGKRRATSRSRPRLARWWPAPALAAAAVLALVVLIPRPPGTGEPTLRTSVEQGDTDFRGDEEPRPGDSLVLEADGGGRNRLELRVYRNERELLARCEGSAGSASVDVGSFRCSRDPLRLRLVLDAVGRYQPVLMFAGEPLPPPAGGLDADLGAVLRAGGRVEMGDEVVVR